MQDQKLYTGRHKNAQGRLLQAPDTSPSDKQNGVDNQGTGGEITHREDYVRMMGVVGFSVFDPSRYANEMHEWFDDFLQEWCATDTKTGRQELAVCLKACCTRN